MNIDKNLSGNLPQVNKKVNEVGRADDKGQDYTDADQEVQNEQPNITEEEVKNATVGKDQGIEMAYEQGSQLKEMDIDDIRESKQDINGDSRGIEPSKVEKENESVGNNQGTETELEPEVGIDDIRESRKEAESETGSQLEELDVENVRQSGNPEQIENNSENEINGDDRVIEKGADYTDIGDKIINNLPTLEEEAMENESTGNDQGRETESEPGSQLKEMDIEDIRETRKDVESGSESEQKVNVDNRIIEPTKEELENEAVGNDEGRETESEPGSQLKEMDIKDIRESRKDVEFESESEQEVNADNSGIESPNKDAEMDDEKIKDGNSLQVLLLKLTLQTLSF